MSTSHRRIFDSEQHRQRAWAKYRAKRRRKLIRLLVYIGMGLLPGVSSSVPGLAQHPGYLGMTAGLGWFLTLGWIVWNIFLGMLFLHPDKEIKEHMPYSPTRYS